MTRFILKLAKWVELQVEGWRCSLHGYDTHSQTHTFSFPLWWHLLVNSLQISCSLFAFRWRMPSLRTRAAWTTCLTLCHLLHERSARGRQAENEEEGAVTRSEAGRSRRKRQKKKMIWLWPGFHLNSSTNHKLSLYPYHHANGKATIGIHLSEGAC